MTESICVDVLYTKFTEHLSEVIWDKLMSMLPNELQEKNRKFVRWQDRHSHLLGKYLMIEGWKKHGVNPEAIERLMYSDFGRPYLEDSLDFNISHSNEYVICAFVRGDCHVGIDIEEVKEVDFNDFRTVMTQPQWDSIENSDNPTERFFKMWTVKEAVIKSHGNGLSIPLDEITVSVGDKEARLWNETWYLQGITISKDYQCTLCTNAPIAKIEKRYVVIE